MQIKIGVSKPLPETCFDKKEKEQITDGHYLSKRTTITDKVTLPYKIASYTLQYTDNRKALLINNLHYHLTNPPFPLI